METKKICLDGLKNVLSPKEMKNVKGGSYPQVLCDCGEGLIIVGTCAFDTCGDCVSRPCSGTCTVIHCLE